MDGGTSEVSRRCVVTPMFFSKKTEHIGEGEKARQGNTGFWGLWKAPAGIYFVLLSGKAQAHSWPWNCSKHSIEMHRQHNCVFPVSSFAIRLHFFAMIPPWEVQVHTEYTSIIGIKFICTMYCLSMDVLKSQIGDTGQWEGLDNNVALRKRGYTGIGKLGEGQREREGGCGHAWAARSGCAAVRGAERSPPGLPLLSSCIV